MLLNVFPAPDGVPKTLSLKNIMTGKLDLAYNSCKVEFGSYILVFEDNNPTNTTKSCSTGAIMLNPTGNTKGDYHFMSLSTGHWLAQQQWTAMPMPDVIITAVEAHTKAKNSQSLKESAHVSNSSQMWPCEKKRL